MRHVAKRGFWWVEGLIAAAAVVLAILWVLDLADLEAWSALLPAVLALLGFLIKFGDSRQPKAIDSPAEAARLIREAAFASYVRGWPGNRADPDSVLEELNENLANPMYLDRRSLGRAISRGVQHATGIDSPSEKVRVILDPILDVLPRSKDYIAPLEQVPFELRDQLLRSEYHKEAAEDDFLAWWYLLYMKELGHRDTLLELLKQRLSVMDPYRFRKAYVETAKLAEETLGPDAFWPWYEAEIKNKPGPGGPGLYMT
jgi:hypothetical protein